jgi:transcriptional regulator with XRE-family HTH domain
MFTARYVALQGMQKKSLPASSTKAEVCKRLVLLRRARGLKQKEIAASAGLTSTQWANYEKLERMPNIQDMIRLADEQEVSLDWIYRGRAASLPHHLAVQIDRIMQAANEEGNDEPIDDTGDIRVPDGVRPGARQGRSR